MAKIKDTAPPIEDSFVPKLKRPTLRQNARKRLTFDLTPYAHNLLRTDADRRNMTQLTLLELMIRNYCDPKRPTYGPETKF